MRPVINSADDAVEWISECTLATVEHLVSLKRKSKSEVERQVRIAQVGIDHIKSSGRKQKNRIADVIFKHAGDVSVWAKSR